MNNCCVERYLFRSMVQANTERFNPLNQKASGEDNMVLCEVLNTQYPSFFECGFERSPFSF